MTKLLLDERPIIVMPQLAKKIGLNEAIVIQQIHYWLKVNEETNKHFYNNRYWMYNSFEKWCEQFPFWSIATIKRIFKNLEKQKILLVSNYNKYRRDRTKWYTIDYNRLEEVASNQDVSIKVSI
ncbi:MAG: hypothetical protein PWP27_200 [Clostridiales bacterium]|jgi:hypothetical protein|nr:hypothetical protein [Clostridiales bacterium]